MMNEALMRAYVLKGLMEQDSEPTKHQQHSRLEVVQMKQPPTHLVVSTLGLIISLVQLSGDRNDLILPLWHFSNTTSNASSTPSSVISAPSSTFALQASRLNRRMQNKSSAVMGTNEPVSDKKTQTKKDRIKLNKEKRTEENPHSLPQHQSV